MQLDDDTKKETKYFRLGSNKVTEIQGFKTSIFL